MAPLEQPLGRPGHGLLLRAARAGYTAKTKAAGSVLLA